MKWAPNKKLHFEVAIIKAIQSLGQATLDEVIEKLGELRGEGTASAPVSARATGAKPEAPIMRSGAAGAERGPKPMPQRAEVTAPSDSKTRVEDHARSVDHKRDPGTIWQAVLAKIPPQKAFVRNSVSAAHVLGIDGRNFKLGFAPGDKAMMDILGTQANRKFVEALLHEITGKDWALKLIVDEALPSKNSAAADDSPNDFKDQPLIKEAIELFNARVRT
jgi:DNA polymerase-3 subunit gamma/tau